MKSRPPYLTKRIEILTVRQREITVHSRFHREDIVIPKHIRERTREAIDRYMRKTLPPSYTLIDLSILGKYCIGLAVRRDYDWFITDTVNDLLARSDNLKGIPLQKLYERKYHKTEIAKERKLYILRKKFRVTEPKPRQQFLNDLAHSHLEEHKELTYKSKRNNLIYGTPLPTNLEIGTKLHKEDLEEERTSDIFKGIDYTAEENRRLGVFDDANLIFHKQTTPLPKLVPFEKRFIIEPDSETAKNPLVELDLAKIGDRFLANSLPKETQLLFGENKMSVSHKVNTLMNVTGIKVRFKGNSTEYTYKTLLPNVKVDEEVIVETATSNMVATITKILGKVSQEVTEEIMGMGYSNIKWAFQSVADLRLQQLKDLEKELYDNIILAEGVSTNKEVLQDLEESIGKEIVTELKAKVSRL